MRILKAKKSGLLFVISGPSGSGKTTLANSLLEIGEFRGRLVKSVSFTTRPRRTGEKNKRDYFFLTAAEFKNLRRAKKILEWTRYLGYYYGTARDFIEAQMGKAEGVLLCLDINGARSIKRAYPDRAVTIFVKPPSLKDLPLRIQKRCRTTRVDEVRRRVKVAEKELRAAGSYDYVLVNKDLKKAIARLHRIVRSRLSNYRAASRS